MFYLISWFLVLALLAAWSTGVWMLHGLATWSMTGAGALMAQSQKIDAFNLPAWTVWGVGSVILAVCAVLMHTLISVTRKAVRQ